MPEKKGVMFTTTRHGQEGPSAHGSERSEVGEQQWFHPCQQEGVQIPGYLALNPVSP